MPERLAGSLLFVFSFLVISTPGAVAGTYGTKLCREMTKVPNDFCKNLNQCKKKCKQRDIKACNFLACLYKYGDGVKKSYKAVFEFNMRACNLKSGDNCGSVSDCYLSGLGVKRNPKKANEYLIEACKLKSASSCHALGARYRLGTFGYRKNPRLAIFYLTEGCRLSAMYCGSLAEVYEKGNLVEKDLDRALKIRERACTTDNSYVADDCQVAGRIYLSLNRKDEARSKFERSCNWGYGESCYWLCKVGFAADYLNDGKLEKFLVGCRVDLDSKGTGQDKDFMCKTLLCLHKKRLLGIRLNAAEKLLCRAGYKETCKAIQDRFITE